MDKAYKSKEINFLLGDAYMLDNNFEKGAKYLLEAEKSFKDH